MFRQSRSLLAYTGQPVEKNKSEVVTAKWNNGYTNTDNSVSPLTSLNSTVPEPDNTYSSPSPNNDTSDTRGLPSADQLQSLYDRLEQTVCIQ